jgi:dephospho-CoA kinase
MEKIILGITGEIAAGKGTTAKYLIDKYGATTHRFSTALRDVAQRMYLEESRENLQKISTMMRENFSDDILSRVIYHDVVNDKNEIIAIDGVRRLGDIEFLKQIPGFKLIYVDTSMENRYERIIQRGENVDDKGKTFEEFKKDHQREAELQIKDLKNTAEFVVDNNGTLEDLYLQIDEIIKK